jgi:hypothetical protein
MYEQETLNNMDITFDNLQFFNWDEDKEKMNESNDYGGTK